MKFALYCPACHDSAVLPGVAEDGSTFDQEAAIDTFTTVHVMHLRGRQNIDVLIVPEVTFVKPHSFRVLN
jgi:hypothetical protein